MNHHNHLQTAQALLQQAPPPSLREIIVAYRTKGDGDRDLLLAMLHAKTAEDQRLANFAALERTLLELCDESDPALNYPSPGLTKRHRQVSPSRSYPYRNRHSYDDHFEPSPKRHRSSYSPPHERPSHSALPPSPYSSHSPLGAEPSPRPTRATTANSMAIDSLLREGEDEPPFINSSAQRQDRLG